MTRTCEYRKESLRTFRQPQSTSLPRRTKALNLAWFSSWAYLLMLVLFFQMVFCGIFREGFPEVAQSISRFLDTLALWSWCLDRDFQDAKFNYDGFELIRGQGHKPRWPEGHIIKKTKLCQPVKISRRAAAERMTSAQDSTLEWRRLAANRKVRR